MNQRMRKRSAKPRPAPSSKAEAPPALARKRRTLPKKSRARAEGGRRASARFQALVETASDWIWEVDRRGVYTYASPKVRDLLGYEPAEVIGKTPFDFMPPDEAGRLRPIVAANWAAAKPFAGLENLNRHKDGRLVFLETGGEPIFDRKGRLQGYRGVDRDITERKRAEEERWRREEEFRAFVETTNEWIWTVDRDGRHTYSNPALQRILGYSPLEFMGQVARQHLHPDDRRTVEQMLAMERVQKDGWSGLLLRWRHRDGTYRYLESTAVPVRDRNGNLAGFRGSDRDITGRKRAEEALWASETRFRSLYENSPDAILLTVPDGTILAANPAACRMFGRTEAEICRRGREELVASSDPRLPALLAQRAATGASRGELTFRRGDGTRFPGEVSSSVFSGPDGQAQTCMVIHDISQRKRAAAELLDSERRYRLLVESVADVVWALDVETGRFRYVSPSVERLRGYTVEEVMKQGLAEALAPGSLAHVGRVTAARLAEFRQGIRQAYVDEVEQPCKDGTTVWTEVTTHYLTDEAGRVLIYGVSRDITARRRAEEMLRATEERFSKAFHLSPLSIAISTLADGVYHEVNEAFIRLTGFSRAEILGRTAADLRLWVDEDLRTKARAALAAGRELRELPISVRTRSGAVRDALYSAVSVELGGVPHVLSLVLDITERKRAEEASRESEERYRRLFELESDAILLVDCADGQILEVNAAAERLYGYRHDEWLRLKVTDISAEPEKTRRVMADEHSHLPLSRHRRQDGSDFPVEVTLSFFDWHGRRVHIAAVRDITERVRTAERVSRLSTLKQELLDARNLPDRLRLITERVGTIFDADFARIWMLEKGDRCEQGCRHAAVREGPEVCSDRSRCLHLMASSGRYPRIDGEHRRVPLNSTRIGRIATGSESGFVTNDLRHDPIVRDRAWAESLGLVSFAGRKLVTPDGQTVGVLAYFGRRPIVPGEAESLDEVAATAAQVILTALTEQQQREFETRMQQAQKLESLGVLAGGIAHDFNNLLTAILGHANLARLDVPPESSAGHSLKEIETASGRAAELCHQMLAYAGKGRFSVEPVNLTHLIRELANLLGVSIPKKVRLRTELPDDLPAIDADPAQIRQVAMNLVSNAAEAIGEADGDITVSTGTVDCDAAFLQRHHPGDSRPPGRHVYLEVIDTGCGMDAGTRGRIFDPFYTTKFTGRGLGLAAVQGIVRKHNGMITVNSEPGRGTTFRVLFPVSLKSARPATARQEAPVWRGRGTILLVDDEEPVRRVAAKILERGGFTVLAAGDGHEAVDLFRTHSGQIVGVLLDLTMPRMDGVETFRELHRIRPGVPVILASGYSGHELAERFGGSGLAGFIQKPYQMSELLARLGAAVPSAP